MDNHSPDLARRLWSRVSKSETGCWLWTGHKDKGYGRIKKDGGKGYVLVHRLAWELTNGPIPPGLNVCHTCDQPSCVLPKHLFLGTHADNVADRHAKGRDALGRRNARYTHPERTPRGEAHWTHVRPGERTRGERVGGAKLTEDKVREIRQRRAEGWTLQRLSTEYGVTIGTIHFIVTGVTWKHVV